ncbi:uncharacterized protein PG986_005690 [Apiospora aurea]|uniref:Uncharacterized protein n=1 Tax=Apiospora aurea TaxID=335848 RepID=A0ABR1QIA6_9PEZI
MFPMFPTRSEGRPCPKKDRNTEEDTTQTMIGSNVNGFEYTIRISHRVAERRVRFPQFDSLPHKTPSDPALAWGRPTNQMNGDHEGSRAPSPYPGARGRTTAREADGMSSVAPSRSLSPATEGQSQGRVSFPQDLPRKTASPPGSSLVNPHTNQKHSKSSSTASSSNDRSRAPSPYPGSRRLISFPDTEERAHRTLPPLRPTNQKQSKRDGSSSSSSSPSTSRSRAPSPHPLSRAHRHQIIQQLESSRTGHWNGLRQPEASNDNKDIASSTVPSKTNVSPLHESPAEQQLVVRHPRRNSVDRG